MSRKTFITLITILMAAAMVLQACGSKNTETSPAPAASSASSEAPTDSGSGEEVTLTVWGANAGEAVYKEAFDKINGIFEERNPNIKIDFQYRWTEENESVAVQTNSMPDLLFSFGNKTPKMAQYVKNELFIPLDKYNLDLSRATEQSINYCTFNDQLYCAPPLAIDLEGIFYNKAIFNDLGLEEPKTWDDFVKVNETLLANNITPIAIPGMSEWWRAWSIFTFTAALSSDVLDGLMKGENKQLTDPSFVDALNRFISFADKGYFDKDALSTDRDSARLAFTNGRAAMIFDGVWELNVYDSMGDDLGFFYVPNDEGKLIGPMTFNESTAYGITSNSKHPDEAAEYLKWIISKEAQEIYIAGTNHIPAIADITITDEMVRKMAELDAIVDNVYTVLTHVSSDKGSITDTFMKDLVPQMFSGRVTAEEAAKILDDLAAYPQP